MPVSIRDWKKNLPVLKGLICALLHLRTEDISSLIVTNPILEGSSYSSKEFILDIEIILNGFILLSLEQQIKDLTDENKAQVIENTRLRAKLESIGIDLNTF